MKRDSFRPSLFRNSLIVIISLFAVLQLLSACHDDDVLTDGAAQPWYELNQGASQHLGVLFPGRTTSTQKLLLYNKNDGALELESIVLRGGEESLFRINVDGMAGTSFNNSDYLHIAKGDSLHVLLEASFFGQQEQREQEYEDFIDIRCNGRTSSIRLAVTVKNVEELQGDTIRHDTLWASGGVDKLVYGTLVIPEGVTLTVEEGMTLFMHDKAGIKVQGTLQLLGSLEKPVRLIGDRTDSLFSNLAYVDMSAQWAGIWILPSSMDNLFDHAEIKGMTWGISLSQDSLSEQQALTMSPQLTVRNSLIKNCDMNLINAYATTMVIENSLLMNSGSDMLSLCGGAYEVTHCTMANYQFWTAFHPYDLRISNYTFEPDSTDENQAVLVHAPLYRCDITNTLIYGNGHNPNVALDYEGYFGSIVPHDSIFHYHFDHCLLNADGEDDDDFVSTIWGEDPLYRLLDMPNYICDPHLLPESPAIGKGNPNTLPRLPFDMDGHARQNPPAIGCFEGD